MTTIRIDGENSAETFWEGFAESFPRVYEALRTRGSATITAKILRKLEQVPGYFADDAPDYAPIPFLVEDGRRGKTIRRP